jgi:hypothetical protein
MTGRPASYGWLARACRADYGLFREVSVHRGGVERTLDAQRPKKRPATLGGTQAFRIGMQPRAPSRKPAPRVGDQGPLDRYHA